MLSSWTGWNFYCGGVVVGKDCVIFQQVTIGSNLLNNTSKQGIPHLGNACYIGAGAKIIGSVEVGDSCRIGANTTVYENVPANSTVVNAGGMRIISHVSLLDNRFYRTNQNGEKEYFINGSYRIDGKKL